MLNQPGHWAKYYPGSPEEQALQRHYSYSDRIRYYWTTPEARAAVDALMLRLGDRVLPETLISQYLAAAWPEVRDGSVSPKARDLVLAAVSRMLKTYARACSGRP